MTTEGDNTMMDLRTTASHAVLPVTIDHRDLPLVSRFRGFYSGADIKQAS